MTHCCFPEIKTPCSRVVKALSPNISVLSWIGTLRTTSKLQGHWGTSCSWRAQRHPRCPLDSIAQAAPTRWHGNLAQHTTTVLNCASLHFRSWIWPFPRPEMPPKGLVQLHVNVQASLSCWWGVFTGPPLLYHVQCPSGLRLGLCLEPNRPGSPAANSMFSTLSTKEEELEEGSPHHWIFVPYDLVEMVLQRETKPLGAVENWCWVSQGQGLFVARAVTCAQVAIGTCFPSKRQVHGWSLWLSLYKSVSTLLLWPTGWSMDVELISGSSPKMGNPDCAMWTMWVHRLCRVALQTSITCVTTMDFFRSLNQWLR